MGIITIEDLVVLTHKRYVDPHGDVKQQPTSDKVCCRASGHNHQLSEKNKPYETDVLVSDTHVNDCLCQKRHDELKKASESQTKENLKKISAVFLQIPEQEKERSFLRIVIFCQGRTEIIIRFQKHCQTFVNTLAFCAYPMTLEFISRVVNNPFGWICNSKISLPGNFIENHKMVLIPVKDARSVYFREL